MKRKRVTLDRGIYKDAYGIAVIVNVGKLRREERFPPDTDLKKLKERRDEIRSPSGKLHRGLSAAHSQRTPRGTSKPWPRCRHSWSARSISSSGCRSLAIGPGYTIDTVDINTVLSRWLNRRTGAVYRPQPTDGGAESLDEVGREQPARHQPGDEGAAPAVARPGSQGHQHGRRRHHPGGDAGGGAGTSR